MKGGVLWKFLPCRIHEKVKSTKYRHQYTIKKSRGIENGYFPFSNILLKFILQSVISNQLKSKICVIIFAYITKMAYVCTINVHVCLLFR